jgi:hypothetical protein
MTLKEILSKDSLEKAIKRGSKALEFSIYIFIALVLIYGLSVLFTGSDPIERKVKKANSQIEKKVDSSLNRIKFLEERSYEFEKKQIILEDLIFQNNQLIIQNNSKLDKLNKIYGKQINNARSYSISQLDSFFRARYKDYYNR